MKKILIILSISIFSCSDGRYKSVKIASIKSKGIIVNMSAFNLVIRTDSSIVTEAVLKETYDYLYINNTIK